MSRDIQPHQLHHTPTNPGVIGLEREIRNSTTPDLWEQERLLANLPSDLPEIFGRIVACRLELVRDELTRRHGRRVAA